MRQFSRIKDGILPDPSIFAHVDTAAAVAEHDEETKDDGQTAPEQLDSTSPTSSQPIHPFDSMLQSNFIHSIFGSVTRNTVTCLTCHHVSVTHEFMLDYSLPIEPPPRTIQQPTFLPSNKQSSTSSTSDGNKSKAITSLSSRSSSSGISKSRAKSIAKHQRKLEARKKNATKFKTMSVPESQTEEHEAEEEEEQKENDDEEKEEKVEQKTGENADDGADEQRTAHSMEEKNEKETEHATATTQPTSSAQAAEPVVATDTVVSSASASAAEAAPTVSTDTIPSTPSTTAFLEPPTHPRFRPIPLLHMIPPQTSSMASNNFASILQTPLHHSQMAPVTLLNPLMETNHNPLRTLHHKCLMPARLLQTPHPPRLPPMHRLDPAPSMHLHLHSLPQLPFSPSFVLIASVWIDCKIIVIMSQRSRIALVRILTRIC